MSRRALAALPTSILYAELRRRQGLTARLAAMRDRLQAKVVALDARIADWGGAANGGVWARSATGHRRNRRATGRGSRSPRPGSLVSHLLKALDGKTMTVTDAGAAVRKAGFKTKATPRSFYSTIAFALARSGRFRRVRRGMYTVA